MASCNTGNITPKKKTIRFSSLGTGTSAATYLVFKKTNNPALVTAIPALLAFAACPVMCAVIGRGPEKLIVSILINVDVYN